MRPRDADLRARIQLRLENFERTQPLPGIEGDAERATFIEQLLESVHRVEYVERLPERPISQLRRDPSSDLYDPLKAAVLFQSDGLFDEACWQVFLSVHFGKHHRSGWLLPRDAYGCLGEGEVWSWSRIAGSSPEFLQWLRANEQRLLLPSPSSVRRGFGNHRKYQSISADSQNGTGAAVTSYVQWVDDAGGHVPLFESALTTAEYDARVAFAILYQEMSVVRSFGRIAKFDYLAMIGKLGLAPIEPNSAYIRGSTGPAAGAALLFDEASPRQLDNLVQSLGEELGLNMQIMEDAICNWQKSPSRLIRFRG